ncbi:response regulator transcription factor [Bdellovibrio svalbardensis]|uniref:Response regulator transcription factor n=1 Tax=Bdellovibrio svalbardensis TaxID=2972972 RepID=A0ABT6DMR7_9BACT|nr:response regulator transcription factor [Bdellovibrio svalbardensis]MDG0818175.1 response regulator transcription factor [Bdellovibrio svalbardensis]
MKKIVNCFIIDDHPLMRQALKAALLEHFPKIHIAGESGAADEALSKLRGLTIDLVVLDHKLQGKTGLELLPAIKQTHPQAEFLIITQVEEVTILRKYQELGAGAILSKLNANDELLAAMMALQAGTSYLSPSIQALIEQPLAESVLTSRELEVVKWVALGKTNKEVASLLDCSAETIKTHKANILRKLNISSSVEISVWAMKHGLI